MIPAWRSAMFVAADDAARLAKAHTRGADVLIIDLEDAVSSDAKERARAGVSETARLLHSLGQNLAVRINAPWRLTTADLQAVVGSEFQAIMVPKVEDAARLSVVSAMIEEWEELRALPRKQLGLIALIESPLGLANLRDVAAVPRVVALALGPEDLSAAMGVQPSMANLQLPCQMLALAAAARQLAAFGAPISIGEFTDLEAYAEAVRAARAMGMTGSLCVHPAQVTVLNTIFEASAAELDDARRIVEAWRRRGDRDLAVVDGRMVDRPVVLRAERLLGRSGY